MRFVSIVAAIAFAMVGLPAMAGSEDDVRASFDKFVTAQNAHDLNAIAPLLLDSPNFLWVGRRGAVWGNDAVLKRLAVQFEGVWKLVPTAAEPKVVVLDANVVQLSAFAALTTGTPFDKPRTENYLMNLLFVRTTSGWKISTILPVPAGAH
jgi:hypothetical protein